MLFENVANLQLYFDTAIIYCFFIKILRVIYIKKLKFQLPIINYFQNICCFSLNFKPIIHTLTHNPYNFIA